MNLIDLEDSLKRPPCPECGTGSFRAIDINDGHHVTFKCPTPNCHWSGYARLPVISKKVVYLDTSTVSHMARALDRKDANSTWLGLYQRLRSAAGAEVICCPVSSILESEAELSHYSNQIIQLSWEFADPGLEHELHVQEAQLFRALDRFLTGQPSALETNPPAKDAFHEEVDRWLPAYSFHANLGTPPEWINARRHRKGPLRDELARIYHEYAMQGASFEEIRSAEASGFGQGIITVGMQSIHRRFERLMGQNTDEDLFSYLMPNSFDSMTFHLKDRLGISYMDAVSKATEFLHSEHAKLIPVADIRSKLHAGLAMLCRGSSPREPKSGDAHDIDHLATYIPYMDILITDRFFADLCNQNHLRLGETYGCKILSIRPQDIPAFIKDIDALVEAAPQAPFANRIAKAINEGGFHQEFAERAAAYLGARGVEPYASKKERR